MIFWDLFLCFLKIGAFSFGGGYAALPLIKEQIVDLHHWLSMVEFTDLVTISQMTPGSIAINAATFVGIRIAGVPGAVIATLGCVLPPCLIVTLVTRFYLRYREMSLLQGVFAYLRPAVVGLIALSGVDILVSALWGPAGGFCLAETDLELAGIFVLCLFLCLRFRMNPITVIALSGAMKIMIFLLRL